MNLSRGMNNSNAFLSSFNYYLICVIICGTLRRFPVIRTGSQECIRNAFKTINVGCKVANNLAAPLSIVSDATECAIFFSMNTLDWFSLKFL